ncbi:hypothetical protein PENTCL1PPCAC_30244 [Pristionchus entomophagus]|uniref:Uncharacterized protein n=1 Tax=Pristionchus entomophagus TaxID=358040 RepID=A0AAV5UQM4_9BILA|nr:hypothetical protein PENTCL1PPCAC_30244 [Pristionchus entomophagus]
MDGASVAIAYAKNVHKQRVEREIRTLPITLSPVVESIDKHIIEQNFTIKCRCMNASLEGVPFVIVPISLLTTRSSLPRSSSRVRSCIRMWIRSTEKCAFRSSHTTTGRPLALWRM